MLQFSLTKIMLNRIDETAGKHYIEIPGCNNRTRKYHFLIQFKNIKAMAQSIHLINALKKILKAHDKTYADVAEHLDLSEASVKRLFSQQSFTLQRLDQICQLLDMEISDLLQHVHSRAPLKKLSLKQEQEIVADLELLLITVCILNHWSVQDIMSRFNLSEVHCIKHLTHLDRLKMIELLPLNRLKLRVAANFQWHENGPIQQFFINKIESDFFSSRFDEEHEKLIVINGMLAHSSNTVFQRKMEQLTREFDELNMADHKLPIDQRYGTTVVIAMRRWKYGLFSQFGKNS